MSRLVLLLAFSLAVACATLACVYPTMLAVHGLLALGAVALVLGATTAIVDALQCVVLAVYGVASELHTLNRTTDQQASSVHRHDRLQSEAVDQRLALARKFTAHPER